MSEEVKNKSEYLVEVRDLKQYFPIKTGFMKTTPLKAVDGVSFSIKPGETLGLVGESGCGKTTVGRSLLRLYTPTSGDVFFDGERVNEKSIGHMRRQMQMVFQDPYSSLNPRMTVEDIIGEPLDVHKLYTSRGERRDKILHLMELVGLNAEHATRYAHEFSGDSVSVLREHLPPIRDLSSVTKQSVHWMFPFRHRSSTCLKSCRRSWALPICSLPMTCWLSITFLTELQ